MFQLIGILLTRSWIDCLSKRFIGGLQKCLVKDPTKGAHEDDIEVEPRIQTAKMLHKTIWDSMKSKWEEPKDIGLISSFLDPHF
ncbi:9099_t:CDS:2 [Entrophospora sp. SA101]|nr:9099_t:CDS:2 [Entrophospora sp. SA101]